MRRSFLPRSIVALMAMTSLPTCAATLAQTQTFSFNPDDSAVLTFSEFNTSLGTLTSVQVEVSFTKSGGSFGADNESASPATVTLTQSVQGSLDFGTLDNSMVNSGYFGLPTSALKATSSTTVSLAASVGDPTNEFNSTGADAYYYYPGNVTVTSSGYIADLSQFQGTGTYDLTFDATQSQKLTGVGGASLAYTPSTVSGYARVTYTYTASVPEPHIPLQLGLFGTCLLFRRRFH